jgi:hypothetical protein
LNDEIEKNIEVFFKKKLKKIAIKKIRITFEIKKK